VPYWIHNTPTVSTNPHSHFSDNIPRAWHLPELWALTARATKAHLLQRVLAIRAGYGES
jgi:hypothetical protein